MTELVQVPAGQSDPAEAEPRRGPTATGRARLLHFPRDNQPRADHLIALMAHSDQILDAVLAAAGRASNIPVVELHRGTSSRW